MCYGRIMQFRRCIQGKWYCFTGKWWNTPSKFGGYFAGSGGNQPGILGDISNVMERASALEWGREITDYARAACGLQYKMDYTKIKETNIIMCYQLYFALKYSAFKVNLNN